MTFEELFPALKPWVETLPALGNAKVFGDATLLDIFAVFGAGHLVGMALLGGCSILLNVRFMGAGLIDATPARIERGLRPWLVTGIVLAILTGLVMGTLTASKVFSSAPFFSKMLALASALIFSFGVTNSIAKADGAISRNAKVAAVIAMLLWFASFFVLVSTPVTNIGLFHLVTACYALLLIFGANRTRVIAAASYAALYGGVLVMFWIAGFNMGYEPSEQIYIDISMYAVIAGLIIVVVLLGYELRKGRAEAASPLARLIAFFSILTWITVATGGRWIGFSP
jgi:uncharacterized membrane protein YbaN (DUF454 family)